MKKLSVCIPVYNGEAYIRQTIEQVLNQSYRDFDLIVIDNASTDSTVAEVKKFLDTRIHLLENRENVGMAGNWNRCLEKAESEYIQILCADDVIEKDCLEKKVQFLNQNEDAALVFSASNICDSGGRKIMSRKPFRKSQKLPGDKMIKKSFRKKNLYGEPSNVMFRKSASASAGRFDPEMGYFLDWEYWLRLSLYGNVGYIDKELSVFRISTQSSTSNFILKNRKKIIQNDKRLVDKCRENKAFRLSKPDFFFHKVAGRIQLYLKILFLVYEQKISKLHKKS